MGSSIVYSERTNEELEELFRSLIIDDEFMKVCQEEFGQYDKFTEDNLFSHIILPDQCDYEEISSVHNENTLKPHVVHEISMSVQYDVEVDRNNPDLTFVKRSINVLKPEHENTIKPKTNRFSNLNLSNDIDRLVKMHDYVHHSQQNDKKLRKKESNRNGKSRKQRETLPNHKRSTTTTVAAATSISVDKAEKYDSNVLAEIVERQLEAARRAATVESFNPIKNQTTRTEAANRAKFVPPPKLEEKSFRHRIDHIEFPKTTLTKAARNPNTFTGEIISQSSKSKEEREKLVFLGQQGIISSAIALRSKKIPDNVTSIELIETSNNKPNVRDHQHFQVIHFETNDDNLAPINPTFRRTKSMRHPAKSSDIANKRASTIISDASSNNFSNLASPLKSIKRNVHHKNETTLHNKQVFKEKNQGSKL